MKKVIIYYLLNKEGQKKDILLGNPGKQFHEIETEATKEILDLPSIIITEEGNCYLPIGFKCSEWAIKKYVNHETSLIDAESIALKIELIPSEYNRGPKFKEIREKYYFDHHPSIEELLHFEKNRISSIQSYKEENKGKYEEMLKQFEEKIKKEEEKQELLRIEHLDKIRKEQEQNKLLKEKILQEKIEWIKNFGSDYLKDCLALGYECQRVYVTERAKKEYPEYIVDFDNNAAWEERVSPSQKSLNEVKALLNKGVTATIVWLTAYPFSNRQLDCCDDVYDFEATEAIAIEDYLNSYDLIRIIK